jgi:hypothetical protein
VCRALHTHGSKKKREVAGWLVLQGRRQVLAGAGGLLPHRSAARLCRHTFGHCDGLLHLAVGPHVSRQARTPHHHVHGALLVGATHSLGLQWCVHSTKALPRGQDHAHVAAFLTVRTASRGHTCVHGGRGCIACPSGPTRPR